MNNPLQEIYDWIYANYEHCPAAKGQRRIGVKDTFQIVMEYSDLFPDRFDWDDLNCAQQEIDGMNFNKTMSTISVHYWVRKKHSWN